MSKLLINQYYSHLDKVVQFGKTRNEQAIRVPFLNLLNEYARKQNYEVIAEITCMGAKGKPVRPDGIVKNLFGLDIGLWESKDEKTDIFSEIDAKIKKGYPLTNILFEDSKTAVLYQRGLEVMKADMHDADRLHDILTLFFSFRSETVFLFEEALTKFKADIPVIVETLRKRIELAGLTNPEFAASGADFLSLCRAEINPAITEADIREMLIQHLLTSDIFNKIFDDPEFHRHNNIARELEKLLETLFSYGERKNLLLQIEHYYDAINSAAAAITDHHEKQKFLKVLYENFYKVYNPKAADRLGVVYTPNEIVGFMVESADYLLHKFFGKTLSDREVEILDPAVGTATFITAVIDHIPKQYLAHKYKNEIHGNEVAILPYYVANLNVEFAFKQKMGYYEEFRNLCFVDTLDNTGGLAYSGKQQALFGLSSENAGRIQRQNSRKISVVIGNPPYNANQLNENENNKNREYPFIDKRIKETFIKHSTAQKTKVYDMYARFYRWAMDRVDKNGIIAFVTNRSFIDSRTFDGFRKCLQSDFSHAFIIDTRSDVRANPKIAGTTHNVFGIQTGVAILFLVKQANQEGACRIQYTELDDFWRKEEKLDWLRHHPFKDIEFQPIKPDKNNNWINLVENDWDDFLPICSKEVKLGKDDKTLFINHSLGIATNRDEWVYDKSRAVLESKVDYFINSYQQELSRWTESDQKITIRDFVDRKIKWTSELEDQILKGKNLFFKNSRIRTGIYRPYCKEFVYFDKTLIHRLYQQEYFWGLGVFFENLVISINTGSSNFNVLAADCIPNNHFNGDSQCFPLFRYDRNGSKNDNLTDWGLEQFVDHYEDAAITKEDIFHYVYAALHHPAYRTKYALNLKRDFPRIPFYDDFHRWAGWGKALMALHLDYETVEPFPLEEHRYDVKAEARRQKELFLTVAEPEEMYAVQPKVKPKLRAHREEGMIEIDELSFLTGVPPEAWEYRLGNRSALEWVLDQYKEKKPTDPTIAEKFNTYRFADYREKVIDLLKRVCTVSVETMRIIREMER